MAMALMNSSVCCLNLGTSQLSMRNSRRVVQFRSLASTKCRWEQRIGAKCKALHLAVNACHEAGGERRINMAEEVQLDLNLPRRSLLVEFTCNVCEARTQRLVNPEAFRRGTVFIQCAGCEAYHKLVDNLNLVEEYDFRNEVGPTKTESDI